MRPDWPAQCLVCQGEGLFGLHLEGLCVCDGGGVGVRMEGVDEVGGGGETKNRQVRREFIFQRLGWICCTDKFELAGERASELGRPAD